MTLHPFPGVHRLPISAAPAPARIGDLAALEAIARAAMGEDRWATLGGSDAEWTLVRNTRAFRALGVRGAKIERAVAPTLACRVLGVDLAVPFLVGPAPFGPHPDNPRLVFEAVRAAGTAMVVQSGLPFERIATTQPRIAFRQLYFRGHRNTADDIRRCIDAGARGIFLTVDVRASPVFERQTRRDVLRMDVPLLERMTCHVRPWLRRAPYARTDVNDISGFDHRHPEMTWADVARIRKQATIPLVLKGILTAEDARLAAEHGIDGIVVSNHGGRAQDRTPATIEVLPEVVDAVGRHMSVLVDSGFRTGLDIFKALALGAQAVCVVRPIFWALAALGAAGPARVLEILRDELVSVMREQGCPTVAQARFHHLEALTA